MKSWMLKLLVVGVGGFAGASLRFAVSECIKALVKNSKYEFEGFPCWTLAVNILGCLIFGFLAGSIKQLNSVFALFLFVGMLGGFTTYSSFAFETYKFLDNGQRDLALWNVLLQIIIGIGAIKLGLVLADMYGWKWR